MEKQKLSESSRIKLSIAIATFNEESCLADCLSSIKELADEIVVVDGSSTDKTVEVAKSFGAKVILADNKPVFHINKQLAIDECQGEWILQLDADEIIPPELKEEISQIIRKEVGESAFWVKRKKMFLGRWIKKGGQYPDPVIRLFKKGQARLPCKSVHEQILTEGEVGWLKSPMVHLPTPSFSVYITKDNRYSTLTALEMKEKKLQVNFFTGINYLMFKPFGIFFSLYFRHLGFLDGFPGFVFAVYSGLHQTSAFIKYWEMKNSPEINVKKDWV